MNVYRVSKRKYAQDLSGEDARQSGGRWNSRGNAMLYTSLTKGLALLESLVHTPAGAQPKDLVLITLRLPPRAARTLSLRKLSASWDTLTISNVTQRLGDDFLAKGDSLGLKVPSVILQGDFNVIINPAHPLAKRIEILEIIDLPVDPRLVR